MLFLVLVTYIQACCKRGPPDFGRSEGAAGQQQRTALLLAPPRFLDFATRLILYIFSNQKNPDFFLYKI